MANPDELHYNYLVAVIIVLIFAYVGLDYVRKQPNGRSKTKNITDKVVRQHLSRQLENIEYVRRHISDGECKLMRPQIETLRKYLADNSNSSEMDREKIRSRLMKIPGVLRDTDKNMKNALVDIMISLELLIEMTRGSPNMTINVDTTDELIESIYKSVCIRPLVEITKDPEVDLPNIRIDTFRSMSTGSSKSDAMTPRVCFSGSQTKEFRASDPPMAVRYEIASRINPIKDTADVDRNCTDCLRNDYTVD
jgi:hypothetical protein